MSTKFKPPLKLFAHLVRVHIRSRVSNTCKESSTTSPLLRTRFRRSCKRKWKISIQDFTRNPCPRRATSDARRPTPIARHPSQLTTLPRIRPKSYAYVFLNINTASTFEACFNFIRFSFFSAINISFQPCWSGIKMRRVSDLERTYSDFIIFLILLLWGILKGNIIKVFFFKFNL